MFPLSCVCAIIDIYSAWKKVIVPHEFVMSFHFFLSGFLSLPYPPPRPLLQNCAFVLQPWVLPHRYFFPGAPRLQLHRLNKPVIKVHSASVRGDRPPAHETPNSCPKGKHYGGGGDHESIFRLLLHGSLGAASFVVTRDWNYRSAQKKRAPFFCTAFAHFVVGAKCKFYLRTQMKQQGGCRIAIKEKHFFSERLGHARL